jgi:hypothetical protein
VVCPTEQAPAAARSLREAFEATAVSGNTTGAVQVRWDETGDHCDDRLDDSAEADVTGRRIRTHRPQANPGSFSGSRA